MDSVKNQIFENRITLEIIWRRVARRYARILTPSATIRESGT